MGPAFEVIPYTREIVELRTDGTITDIEKENGSVYGEVWETYEFSYRK